MTSLEAVVGALLLGHASCTDLRGRRIRNWALAVGAAAGLALAYQQGGWPGLLRHAQGVLAGTLWWLPVAALRLGPGDAKLAMALGAVLGPRVALAGPAAGFVLCAAALLPWACWRRARGLAWRGVRLPLAPWIAAGTALAVMWR